MTPEQFRKVDEVFQKALILQPGARTSYIDLSCGDDPAVRDEVRAMLAHDEKPRELFKTPALAAGLQFSGIGGKFAGGVSVPRLRRIGAYRVLGTIGEGGFGVVYLAEQENPRRTVAVKIVKPNLATPSMLKRFEYEAQVLGRLQHPGIAQIFEAGVADAEVVGWDAPLTRVLQAGETREPLDAGAPSTVNMFRYAFLAMEHIQGKPLDEYARSHALSVAQRIELIARVCDAVQYAHQRGVIHRDIKPGNILVADDDADGAPSGDGPRSHSTIGSRSYSSLTGLAAQPKILDFGIARASNLDLPLTTFLTSAGQLIGTLPYMSPEQVAGDPREVDTRADVYSLGVILYQILSGRLPYDLRDCSLPEAARKIRDESPPALGAVSRACRGEIDVMVMKAVEKDRSRRYQSAGDLAADLRRYLNGEPIEARRDSALYVLRKNLRRYRGAVAAGAIFLMLLSAFGVISFVQAERNATLAYDERLARNSADALREQADRQASRADAAAGQLALELSASTIERGRLLGLTGDVRSSEDLLWTQYLLDPNSEHARWALWELYSHQPNVASFGGHSDEVLSLALAPDNDMVATGSVDKTVRLWSLKRGACTAILRAHDDRVIDVEFDPSGHFLAAISLDGFVNIWDVARLVSVSEWNLNGDYAFCAHFSPDGRWLATTNGARLRIWDWRNNDILGDIQFDYPIRAIRFNPQNSRLLAVGDEYGRLRLLELDDAHGVIDFCVKKEAVAHADSISAIAFNPSGSLLLSGGRDRVINLWDGVDCVGLRSVLTSNGTVRSLCCSADGSVLAAGGWWELEFWNTEYLTPRRTLPLPVGCYGTTFLPDGSTLTTDGMRPCPALRIWEPETTSAVMPRPAQVARPTTLAVTPDGKYALTAGALGEALVWDLETRTPRTRIHKNTERIHVAVLSPDGKRAVFGNRDGGVEADDALTGQRLWVKKGISLVSHPMCISPDGANVIFGGTDGDFRLMNLESGARVGGFTHGDEALFVRYSRDARRIFTVTRKREIAIWDAETLAPAAEPISSNENAVWCLDVSPDDRYLAAGNWTKAIQVWDLSTRRQIANLEGHTQLVVGVAFDPRPGSRLLASCSSDGMIKLWDLDLRMCVATLNNGSDVAAIAFIPGAPKRGTLLSVGGDGKLKFWDLSYYDRHIAGNAEYQVERLGPGLQDRVDLPRLRAWAHELRQTYFGN